MESRLRKCYVSRMARKGTYTLSRIEPDKTGPGWHIRAVPDDAYASELIIDFDSEEEARTWLRDKSAAWVAELEASKRPRG